jgi:hypothetical protein
LTTGENFTIIFADLAIVITLAVGLINRKTGYTAVRQEPYLPSSYREPGRRAEYIQRLKLYLQMKTNARSIHFYMEVKDGLLEIKQPNKNLRIFMGAIPSTHATDEKFVDNFVERSKGNRKL